MIAALSNIENTAHHIKTIEDSIGWFCWSSWFDNKQTANRPRTSFVCQQEHLALTVLVPMWLVEESTLSFQLFSSTPFDVDRWIMNGKIPPKPLNHSKDHPFYFKDGESMRIIGSSAGCLMIRSNDSVGQEVTAKSSVTIRLQDFHSLSSMFINNEIMRPKTIALLSWYLYSRNR